MEDASLADNLPQRFIYRYDVVFDASNGAFSGLSTGASRLADVQVKTADRSGNETTASGQIKLFREANPFMRDGDPSWLSIDTRVFRLFEGESKFNATLNPGRPENFIQQVLQNLNAGSTGTDTFDNLPTNQASSALEYSTAIDNPSAGTSQKVHNFALAKVRLQGANGAADVRAFFRLFRYTSSNLIFDASTGYRTHSGATAKVSLLGFTSAGAGGQVISIPFFAQGRVPYSQDMRNQTDTPNVKSFPPGPAAERELYFGVYLDINQTGARLPATFVAAHPDGGFAAGDVRIVDSHTLKVLPGDATYLPVPNVRGGRIPGVITVLLPAGIRKGQEWKVDVVQLRGGEQRLIGGFQIDIQVSEARLIADAERLLEHMFERLSLTAEIAPWHPVLARRVETIRGRAAALAEYAGIEWDDPTVRFDAEDPSVPLPIEGVRLRVVLERIQILEDRDPRIKGRGEIRFAARVYTANNGGLHQATALPPDGVFRISDRPGKNVLELNQVLFEGYAADDLRLEMVGTEKDTFDPDDTIGKYTRLFCGTPDRWFGAYGPNGEMIDPEDMLAWRIWYRIERP